MTHTKVKMSISSTRPPIVVVMGHIDHGKSTLLDYIRKTNVTEKEAGGITQHVGAYEVTHTTKDGVKRSLTFLDTPGHAAFSGIRARGAEVADIAILVVSAEDGVKPQTLETLKSIRENKIPFVVAITKIDKPEANLERVKQNLLENEVYLEGYGGEISFVPISSKTGEGIEELLDIILLTTDLKGIGGNDIPNASGFIVETALDRKKGLTATIIVTEGTLHMGMVVTSGKNLSPVRIMENCLGKNIEEAKPGMPVRIVGWNELPQVGEPFSSFGTKREAEKAIAKKINTSKTKKKTGETKGSAQSINTLSIPIVLKADSAGSLEAMLHEINLLSKKNLPVSLSVIASGLGGITESDVKTAMANSTGVIAGFNALPDPTAKRIIEKNGLKAENFSVIYAFADWLSALATERTPKVLVQEIKGMAKIIRVFSQEKDRQIIGGKVLEGSFSLGDEVKIFRREKEIGSGKVRDLEKQKVKTKEVLSGSEFGAIIQSQSILAPGDYIKPFIIVSKPMEMAEQNTDAPVASI